MSEGRKPETTQTQQQLFASDLLKLADYLDTFLDYNETPPVFRKDLTLHEFKQLLRGLEDLNLTGIDKLLDASVKKIEEKGLAVNPDNSKENIFAKYYSKHDPHETDKTIFDPKAKMLDVIKQAYQLMARSDRIGGMNRGHASLDATEAYYKGHDKGDPINQLIDLRSKQQLLHGAIIDLINKSSKVRGFKDTETLQSVAGQVGIAALTLRELASAIGSSAIPIPEGVKIDSPIQKPQIMTVGEFRSASMFSRFSLRPKLLKEIDYQLGKCLDGTKAHGRWNLFWKKSEALTMADPLKQWQILECKLELALGDDKLDGRRKEGVRQLLEQVQGKVSYLKDKTSSTMAIYSSTTGMLAEKAVPTGSEEHVSKCRSIGK